MSKTVNNLARKLLNEIVSESDESPFETLYCLMEVLENKVEPDSEEIYLVSEIYQVIERFKLLEEKLRKYVGDNKKYTSNKLADLYKETEVYSISKMFDD